MRSQLLQLKKLRDLRGELDELVPKTGRSRWLQIFRELRWAGAPRSVRVCERIEILTGVIADPSVSELARLFFRLERNRLKCSAAYCDRLHLDREKLARYLKAFRENDYEPPWIEKWEESLERCAYPYDDQTYLEDLEDIPLEEVLEILARHHDCTVEEVRIIVFGDQTPGSS